MQDKNVSTLARKPRRRGRQERVDERVIFTTDAVGD